MTDVDAFASALSVLPEAARQAALEALEKEFARAPGEAPVEFHTLEDAKRYFGQVRWLWPKWVPCGHLTLIAGPQGTGKSYFAAYLISVIAGVVKTWPDGAPVDFGPSDVVLVETEEMRGAYAERLEALGVPLHRVKLPFDDPTALPDLSKDLDVIAELVRFTGAKAVIVDSLSGGHDWDENAPIMRRLLQALARLAAETGAAVIVVHHLRKRSALEPDKPSLDRIRGSSTISQFCRSVIALWRPGEEADGAVRVETLKSNFCKPPEPLGFEVTEDGQVVICEAPDAEGEKRASVLERACEFLRVELERGARPAKDVLLDAELAGYSRKTLYAAKEALRVVSVQTKYGWVWSLPVREGVSG